ncbi:MAG: response regulator transcription factor [Chloroflexota bacterium]|nr:response regulator transcription factor [Chloroflexota bacterium]
MTKTSVLVIEDHPAISQGLHDLLQSCADLHLVAAALDGETELRLVKSQHPDVVLLDLELPDQPGAAVARQLQTLDPAPQCLVYSAYDDPTHVHAALADGVAGYLLQMEPLGTVAAAVRAIAQGQQQWTAEQMARILHWREEAQRPWESLTERERKVLRLLAEGRSNQQGAEALCVTLRTVESHVTSILSKLGVASRLEAVVWVHNHLPEDLWKSTG